MRPWPWKDPRTGLPLRPIMGGQTPQPNITNPGQRYNLGYVDGQYYGIWDRQTNQLVQQFPLDDSGWTGAWQQWQSWEAAALQQPQPQQYQQAPQQWPQAPQRAGQPQWGQPQYGQPQYGQPGYPSAPVAQRTNGMAIAALVLGILWLSWVGSILALVFGYIAKSQIDQSRGAQGGRGLAIAGIVLGWIGIATLVIYIIVAASVNSSG